MKRYDPTIENPVWVDFLFSANLWQCRLIDKEFDDGSCALVAREQEKDALEGRGYDTFLIDQGQWRHIQEPEPLTAWKIGKFFLDNPGYWWRYSENGTACLPGFFPVVDLDIQVAIITGKEPTDWRPIAEVITEVEG